MAKALTPLGDDRHLGQAMLALTAMQRAFVLAKVLTGANNKEAARAAGYSTESDNALKVQGHNLAHDPRIQAAIGEEAVKLMKTEGAASIRTLVELRDDVTAEKTVRLKAALELLNRSGFHARTETINHNIETHLTVSQQDARILQLAAELGIAESEARKMLIAPGAAETIIDAVFENVTAEPPAPLIEAEIKAQESKDHKNALRRERRRLTPEQLAERKAANEAAKSAARKREYQEAQKNRQQHDGDNAVAGSQPVAADDDLSDIY